MVMPTSFRQLLVEESRLPAYRVSRPTDLPEPLASPDWQTMTEAYRRHPELDDVDRAGLVSWLTAACLPDAVTDVLPDDLSAAQCHDPVRAIAQYGRALALFQRDGLEAPTAAAFGVLVEAPVATSAHLLACGVWGYLLARNTSDAGPAQVYAERARAIFDELVGRLPAFDRALWRARIPLREVTIAERRGDIDEAWKLVEQARTAFDEIEPTGAEDGSVATELRRRIIDRRVEIAVKRGDREAELATIAEGVALDPYCVKIRMQEAEAAERGGDLAAALAGYLLAARLGPFGTAFALLRAASCAGRLRGDSDGGHREEAARVLCERAGRAAPRSAKTREALVRACLATGDEAMAEMVRAPADGYQNVWHYRAYGSYLNLGPAGSPCLYAHNPRFAYQFAAAGEYPTVDLQRVMPPAFRLNLARESGLTEFAVGRPADLPPALRTPAWQQLCDWVDGFADADPYRALLTSKLLYHLGLRKLLIELLPGRPAESLQHPAEFNQYVLRELARYAEASGRGQVAPVEQRLALIEAPDCPLYLRFTGATFAVVYAGRDSKDAEFAAHWRERAERLLEEVLASDEFTEFDKVMMHSRYYRGVGFLPFLRHDAAGLVADMEKAEEYARQVQATNDWQDLLRRENLCACLESRAKEALRLGDAALAHRRLGEALALDPYHPMSNMEFAESLSRQERYAEAAGYYLRAARLGPYGTAMAYHMAGECLRRAGDTALAEDCFVQALRVDPHAVSAARGWRRTASAAMADLATEYTDGLQEWGSSRGKSAAHA
jgi:tetratricopeptide (TPR) repeat protein